MRQDRAETVELMQNIKKEIDQLAEQQSESLKTATYLGMSSEEAREYDDRRDRIAELTRQLESLQDGQRSA